MTRIKRWTQEPFWVAAMIHFAIVTTATNLNETLKSKMLPERTEVGLYAWSSWGSWSACSRTCGGGVSYQERQCLPRARNLILNSTLAPPVITVRVTRQTQECAGVARRYHECNTLACRGGSPDTRAEQCSSYDRRPFRGRYYTWLPYIDGNAPCMLNCRPMGHHFYASLSLVADGTPCTLEGYRAICVQGSCKAVGREAVLSIASSREVKCGRRLVSGLFARPRLPLGYSYITTVPRGACRLNVSEILPGDNYIALKITNGSYIMNGEFAISAPGTYEAAGARFTYTRSSGLDAVFSAGPIHYPIDIMILYTEPNPSIKYEYFTDAMPGEVDIESITKAQTESPPKHIRRHHGFDYSRANVPKHPDGTGRSADANDNATEENIVGTRKFLWKIMSHTQCSRSCGGGFQVGKYRCVESSNAGDREVSPAHCVGSAPAGRRRRCGNVPCPPRWRAAAWSSCPQCGPATKTRIVGCVQDHSKGITKISDTKCPAQKPATIEECNIPDCSTPDARIDSNRNPKNQVDAFRDGQIYTIEVNSSDPSVGPEYKFGTAAWLYTNWSECVGWCVGGGVQTRAVRCADPSGCAPTTPPDYTRTCSPKISCEAHDGHWFTGDWSACTSPCEGKQVRGVLCIGGTGRHLRESACRSPKPESERTCGQDCTPDWFTSDWGQCLGNCSLGIGVQHRTVVCARGEDPINDSMCPSVRPHATQPCTPRCTDSSLTILQSQTVEKPSTQRTTAVVPENKDCEDKLTNCALAVQARLCHYKYYIQNCCDSCRT